MASDLKKEAAYCWKAAADFKRKAERETRPSEREICFELYREWLRLAVAYEDETDRAA